MMDGQIQSAGDFHLNTIFGAVCGRPRGTQPVRISGVVLVRQRLVKHPLRVVDALSRPPLDRGAHG